MPKTNFCRGRRPLLPQALVKLGNHLQKSNANTNRFKIDVNGRCYHKASLNTCKKKTRLIKSSAFGQIQNVQRLHSSRRCTFSLSFRCTSCITQSTSVCLDLPLPLFPYILPSIISLCRELPLRTYPIQFFCLVRIIFIKDLFHPPF